MNSVLEDLNSSHALSPQCHHQVACHFKTISQAKLYQLKECCPNPRVTFSVDFSLLCIIKQLVDSLEQNICCEKTSFHPTISFHQVWGKTEIQWHIYVLGGSMCMLREGCSLSMLHTTCEKLHRGVWSGGLSMSNIMCMHFYFEPRGIKMYSIPYIVQIELTYISIKCGLVNSNIYWFFNSSGSAMVLPLYYLGVILSGGVACIVTMVV